MTAFTRQKRQAIIDEYLSATGENLFIPGRFIDWLQHRPDHEAYPWFYGKDDYEAAREYRIGLARRMAAGLRIVARVQETSAANVISVTVREFPAYVSPVASRSAGGGYTRFDPHDPAALSELRRQGAVAMRAWLVRYRGAYADTDLSALEEIASGIDADSVARPA